MRLWSLHPKYLDTKGLVALWREGLLAQKVLAGKTKGYRHHPQLQRFREARNPLASIGYYLAQVVIEAEEREYRFDHTKILVVPKRKPRMSVTRGQLKFEAEHLLKKLKKRDRKRVAEFRRVKLHSPHPCFHVIAGKIHDWERP